MDTRFHFPWPSRVQDRLSVNLVVAAMTTPQDPLDLAWRIHAALTDWTGKVDAKASFALTLGSAVLGGVVVASSTGPLRSLDGGAVLALRAGVVLLCASVVLAALAVIPRLRSRDARRDAAENFIFFGHLKEWTSDRLEDALRQRDALPMMARQNIAMSEIAWRKHRFVQISLCLTLAGAGAVSLAGLLGP